MTDTTKPTPGWASHVRTDDEAAAFGPTIPPLRPVLAFPSVEARDAAADVLSLGGPGNAVMVARAERDAALEALAEVLAEMEHAGLDDDGPAHIQEWADRVRALLPKETDDAK